AESTAAHDRAGRADHRHAGLPPHAATGSLPGGCRQRAAQDAADDHPEVRPDPLRLSAAVMPPEVRACHWFLSPGPARPEASASPLAPAVTPLSWMHPMVGPS